MRRVRRLICFAMALLGALATCLSQTNPAVSYQLRSKDFDHKLDAPMIVTVDLPLDTSSMSIKFITGSDITVRPQETKVSGVSGKTLETAIVSISPTSPTGDYSLIAHAVVDTKDKKAAVTIDQSVPFSYQRRISLSWYFVLGLIGFALGYMLRIILGVIKVIPPPALAPAPVPGPPPVPAPPLDGRLTAFVKAHYYPVDFGVSLIVAFIVLAYLMRDGHAPDTASYWNGAMLTGVGLGFLTNNDLLSKVKV